MTQVPKIFYGQVTYDDQKQAYVFVQNNRIVPIENMCIIYHDPTKRGFQYNQKTRQFKQVSLHECKLSMRHLLRKDVIFHRITGTTSSKTQRQPLNDIDRQMKQKNIHDHAETSRQR